jgi:membrane protease YdiL (CAAX protease family)
VVGLVGTAVDTPQGLMWGKAVDVVLKLAPIFVLLWLAHEGLDSIYIRRGKLGWSLTVGLLALANFTATAIAVVASKGGDMVTLFANLPWWFAFSLINAFMEEIWFRGLFLKRLVPAIGAAGALPGMIIDRTGVLDLWPVFRLRNSIDRRVVFGYSSEPALCRGAR